MATPLAKNRALLALPVAIILLLGSCLVTFLARTMAQGMPAIDALGHGLDPLLWPYWWVFSIVFYAGAVVLTRVVDARSYWVAAACGSLVGISAALVGSAVSAAVFEANVGNLYSDLVGTTAVFLFLSLVQATPLWSALLFCFYKAVLMRRNATDDHQ
ncbi:hypothetical protein [Leifsonia sp. RAF41]|uniref:hypothetical protein n=1 Tax=Leifsonia sp. RAF41 TaxID=3233056 RepID=UPI003F956E1B